MALLPPVNVAQGRKFGSAIAADYSYWHIGTETAMFTQYPGAVLAKDFHAGVDFPAASGTAIVASETGKVEYAGWAPAGSAFDGGGNIVNIHIAGGMNYVSCHLSRIRVAAGATVARGQRIGDVGTTGNTLGAHDHFVCYTKTSSGAKLFRNPSHFLPGGKYVTSALIKPAAGPVTVICKASTVTSNYAAPRKALIAPNTTVYGYNAAKPGVITVKFTAPAAGSAFDVSGRQTVSWPGDCPDDTVPHGVFLVGVNGVFAGQLVSPSVVKAADGKAW